MLEIPKEEAKTCDKVSNSGADGEEVVEVAPSEHQAGDGQRGKPE